jgi:hypothetical protein
LGEELFPARNVERGDFFLFVGQKEKEDQRKSGTQTVTSCRLSSSSASFSSSSSSSSSSRRRVRKAVSAQSLVYRVMEFRR